jgi:cytidylate kinase
MTVITISREIGSGGGDIAKQVADSLDYHFVDKKMIERVLMEYGFAQFPEEYEITPGFWSRFDTFRERMIRMLDRVIQAVAHHGNVVILGRGSFAVLGDLSDVLNVRIQAPAAVRAKRLMDVQHITDFEQATALVEQGDELRRSFIHSWYQTRWDAADAFDLVINTDKTPPSLATKWILETNRILEEHWDRERPSTRNLPVDIVLADTVDKTIKRAVSV